MKFPTKFLDPLREKLNSPSLKAYVKTLPLRTEKFVSYFKNALEVCYVDTRYWVHITDENEEIMESYFLTVEEIECVPELAPYAAAIQMKGAEGIWEADLDEDGEPILTSPGQWDPINYNLWTLKEEPEDVH